MPKTNIVFLETEKWEQDYIKEKLSSNRELSLNFCKKPLGKISEKEMAVIKTADILAVFIYSIIDKIILEKLFRLKFIATMSTGYDHIDLNTCKEKGIKVSNVPFYGDNTVAEHTFALILAFSRKLPQSFAKTRFGDFTLNDLRGFDLKGKTIGIIGLGHIGEWTARIAFGFGMKILAFDPKKQPKLSAKFGVKYTTLDYLLGNSDIITLHAPYNEQTRHLINKNNIVKIKKGALLINTARGGLVETEALLLALQKGILAGAGLDVLEEECFIKEEKELLTKPFQKTCDLRTVLRNHLLINNPKVLITPHNGFNSQEALLRILDSTIENIKGFSKGKPINLVG
ncbi:MAG: NAD(P)-dependent oxidoreductase [Patescibacteria group bacterium]